METKTIILLEDEEQRLITYKELESILEGNQMADIRETTSNKSYSINIDYDGAVNFSIYEFDRAYNGVDFEDKFKSLKKDSLEFDEEHDCINIFWYGIMLIIGKDIK